MTLLRWIVGAIGGVLSAAALVPGLPLPPWAAAMLGIVGGALTGSLKTWPDTVRRDELPADFFDLPQKTTTTQRE